MTEPDGTARRRRRRAHRPAGPPNPVEADAPRAGAERSAAGNDPSRAGAERSGAGIDPSRAGTERSGAGIDPSRAGNDPSRAGAERSPEKPAKARGAAAGRRRTAKQADPSRQHGRDNDRGWRELVGNSPSQVGVSGALRARDVARPGPAELATAERTVQIVRRDWQPPADESVPGAR